MERAEAGTATGSISGVLYHDLDGDGLRDSGETGLAGRIVILSRDGTPIDSAGSVADGSYQFESVQPGSYALQAVTLQQRSQCGDRPFIFNPYVQRYCATYPLPWNTTRPDSVAVTIGMGAAVIEDFGAQPADVAVIGGIALLEDGRAQEGTLIEAVFNDQECGTASTTAKEPGLNFLIEVLGDGERAGCPAAGDPFRFRVGGVAAAEVRFYEPFERTGGRLEIQPLSAIRQHSWLWAERRTSDPPLPGAILEALVGGTICGRTEVEYVGQEAGFSRLLVASDELIDGCGNADAVISFRTASLDGATTLRWESDIREMSPQFYGDVTCNYGASALDALLLLQMVGGARAGLPCPDGSDVSGSGATDAIDAALVLQFGAGFLERLPPRR
jgi:hypothetical protein